MIYFSDGSARLWRFALIFSMVVLASCGGGSGSVDPGAISTPDSAAATIGASGGSLSNSSGSISISVPANALAANTTITVAPATADMPQGNIGSVLELGPTGTTFATPVTIRVKYDPNLIPPGVDETSLTVAFLDGAAWTDIPTDVDTVNKVLVAQTSHFSTFAYKIWDKAKKKYGAVLGYMNGVAVYSNQCVDPGPSKADPSKPGTACPPFPGSLPVPIPDTHNFNNAAGYNTGLQYQCVEFVNRYYYQVYGKKITEVNGAAGDAYSYFNKDNVSARGLVRYENGGTEPPQVGDIIVAGGTLLAGGGLGKTYDKNGNVVNVGHVAIVGQVTPTQIFVVQQNFTETTGDLNYKLKLTKSGSTYTVGEFSNSYPVRGWLRRVDAPKTTPTPVAEATAFLALYDASMATAWPANGAAHTAFSDGCSLSDGYSKPVSIALFDADPAKSVERNKYRIGSTRTNVQVLADRTTTNSDGSSRRELDIQYQINYADGTVDNVAKETLISGSSSGSIMADGKACATPDVGGDWRFFGNRSVVEASVQAYNQRNERYSLATGSPLTSAVGYSKYAGFHIYDPSKVAKYVVITGPGLPSSGVKMVSPRIQRDDPLFAGKRGNYVDWQDTDSFRFCRVDATTGRADANAADCVTFGAASNTYGTYNQTAAAADTNFATYGFVAGGAYSVAVYNDDGWKTVNGHATQTPIATYTRILGSLPYSAAALAGSGVSSDFYPRVTNSLAIVQIATNIRNKASFTSNVLWTALGSMPDGAKFGWGDVYAYVSGRATTTTNTWPGSRQIWVSYPAAGATGIANYTVPAPSSNLVTPTYGEFTLELSNRNGSKILSMVSFE